MRRPSKYSYTKLTLGNLSKSNHIKKQNMYNFRLYKLTESITKLSDEELCLIKELKKQSPEAAIEYSTLKIKVLEHFLNDYNQIINELTTINHQEKKDNDQQEPDVN